MTVRAISRQAYQRHVDSGRALTQWQRVYAAIEAQPGITRAELERATGIRINAICPRVHELVDAGMVSECGERRCRATGEMAHGLTTARRFHGGDSRGYPPEQVALWEREQDALIRPTHAREIAAQTDGEIKAYLAWWQNEYGAESAAKFRAKVIEAWQERRREQAA